MISKYSKITYTARLEPLSNIKPALYNPRDADPYRLQLIKDSLSRLGWLLPIYGTKSEDGTFELISGHQRSLVAAEMGYTSVPFVELPEMTLNQRKAINILFNRGTNDFGTLENSSTALDLFKAQSQEYEELLSSIPAQLDFYPCLNTRRFDLKKIWDVNAKSSINYARNTARALTKEGVIMPIVVEADTLKIVNGIGRVQYLLEKEITEYDVIFLNKEQAKLARISLNLISMSFSLEKHYEDHLRHSSFRRSRSTRTILGRGFCFTVLKAKRLGDFDILNSEDKKRWKAAHGQNILDFGAGHLFESQLLTKAGFNVASFEPYRVIADTISKEESMKCIDLFLEKLDSGMRFDSIFISSVFNSVPFRSDREHIIQICSALCDEKTRLFVNAMHEIHRGYRSSGVVETFNNEHSKTLRFKLDYETGIVLGDINAAPKVQKYHTNEELYEVIKTGFGSVSVKLIGDSCCAVASSPIWTVSKLRSALEFEFNLPYPDGSRMGRVGRAIEVFEKRLGITLT